ncbi:MAG: FAD-binding oxidoreductase [Actinomycetota bacterium]|nr:FAD-binding oxidoreductase [Actinomycetota bacterium]
MEVGTVVTVTSPKEVTAVLAAAGDAQASVVVRGAGTKLDWGAPPRRADIVVDVSGLGNVLEHAAGDLVCRVQPGVRVADLQATLAPAGQRLAVDELVPGSTVGGIIATGLAGPLRLAHGSVRDLVLGVTVALAGGTSATSGGRVVKNVAGYDLGKLYTGSFGTLGVITEAFLRLHPLPERSAWLTIMTPDAVAVGRAVSALSAARITPAAVEIHDDGTGPARVVALLEGTDGGVEGRLDAARELPGTDVDISTEAPGWWARMPGLGAGETLIKATTTIAEVGRLVAVVRRAAVDAGAVVEVNGSAGAGVVYFGVGAGAPPGDPARLLEAARRSCASVGGAAIVLRAPAEVRDGIDAWGPVPALALMRRLKDSFDPGHLLAPGRFVGGI